MAASVYVVVVLIRIQHTAIGRHLCWDLRHVIGYFRPRGVIDPFKALTVR